VGFLESWRGNRGLTALRVILWPQGIDVTATGVIGIGAAVVVMIIVIFAWERATKGAASVDGVLSLPGAAPERS
jgi:hypothetical protein